MTTRRLLLGTALTVLLCMPAAGQDARKVPPESSVKLSDIIAKVEAREGFRYVDEIDWSEDGYTVIYFTSDKAKVEITFDAVTGETK